LKKELEMEVRYSRDPQSFTRMNSAELRAEFLVTDLFAPGAIKLVYSNVDRMIIGSAVPTQSALSLTVGAELRAKYFAERREIGVFNIGEPGQIIVDDCEYPMAYQDMLYIGRGSRTVNFTSNDADRPARFYLVSLPAHKEYPTAHCAKSQANRIDLGSAEAANVRTIFQYIRMGGVPSCQLVMGFTELAEGSVWNTLPAHTHARRSEAYLYFNLPADQAVFHLMGDPQETRHLVVRDCQVVLSPSWSIHAGVGSRNYSFIWAMGGENQAFDDMDPAPLDKMI
jgi:4-deoxy-L-threo-5-hexosulose-uronate ketol-isomerase